MNKSELESKHLSELHELAAEAGVERYRMLSRAELIERLAGGDGKAASKPQGGGRGGDSRRRSRDRKPRQERKPGEQRGERKPREQREPRREPAPEPVAETPAAPPAAEKPKRKRRRRRWGRRRKGVRVQDLLLPPAGRQALVYADSRAACTALLREVAAELAEASNGPDPIALLVDPTPEELADWRREAPKAEIVAAGKANHTGDAIAQARSRAAAGEDVIVLIDSLTRYATEFADADEARDLFDAGRGVSGGSLTVVAALERSQ